MSSGIIENAEELKAFYLQTDLANVSSVQSAIKEITENVYVAGKERYLEALRAVTPAYIAKARKYHNASSGLKKLGWIVMIVFAVLMVVIDSDFDDAITTWLSLGFWVGVAIQIYISVLKSAWSKLTLSGAVIHPVLKTTAVTTSGVSNSDKTIISQTSASASQSVDSEKFVFCSECGRKNNTNSQFCENCGTKL